MNRRDFSRFSLAAVGGVFMGRRWYQQGRGLIVPDNEWYGLWTQPPGPPCHFLFLPPPRDSRSLEIFNQHMRRLIKEERRRLRQWREWGRV